MKLRKGNSISAKLNLWYTLLMCVLSVGLILSLVTVARMAENSEAQQNLIRSVERNIDEIEVENGILDIESDFAYKTGDIYSVVFSYDGNILGGEYPQGAEQEIPLEAGRFDKFGSYYIYDTKIEFTKYDYKINGKTGEIISSEVEGADYYASFEGNLDFIGEGCSISCKDAFDAAVKKSGIESAEINIINVKSYEYNDDPIYEVEFHSTDKAYDDIWVRGVVSADGAGGVWSLLVRLALIILPVFMIICSVIGRIITGRALEPLKLLDETVDKIQSGKDLTRRIDDIDADPLISGLAKSFNKMFSRLQLSFESERQFSGDVSHELRTPTAVILAECEYQLSRQELDEEDKEGFEGIQKQAESMKKLISQLLEMTKIEQSEGNVSFEREELSLLVNAVAEDFNVINEKNITLVCDVDEGIFMELDVLSMTRLVSNLLSNAFNYGKENGRVNLSLKEKGDKIILSVKDDGVGIAKEHIDKIWNRFYRADKSRCREKGCSGLGLPMVKQIALLHSGDISVISEEGKGSEFIVEFPVKK